MKVGVGVTLKDCLKMFPVKLSDMTMYPPVRSTSGRISMMPTWSSAQAKISTTCPAVTARLATAW